MNKMMSLFEYSLQFLLLLLIFMVYCIDNIWRFLFPYCAHIPLVRVIHSDAFMLIVIFLSLLDGEFFQAWFIMFVWWSWISSVFAYLRKYIWLSFLKDTLARYNNFLSGHELFHSTLLACRDSAEISVIGPMGQPLNVTSFCL
jgi:hypothetical protein